jgi:transcriptional regulator with XRE-family HTH domain
MPDKSEVSPGQGPWTTLAPVPIHERRVDRGARIAMLLHRHLGQEIRDLRRSSGPSQRRLADELGMSHAVISRLETGESATTLETYARLFAVLGSRLSIKVYPEASPLRDEAHLRLMERLRSLLHGAIRVRTEVPLGLPDDLRAWDMELSIGTEAAKVEAETVLDDLQALERRIALKAQDGNTDLVLLLVADTDRNRRVLRAHRETLRARFPLDTREALGHLRAGRLPPASAIILL